jgi:ankyrin repeat protein
MMPCEPRELLLQALHSNDVDAAERLLSEGVDLQVISDWWAPGFGTHKVGQNAALLLVERGAQLTPHAASGLGLTDRLAEMLGANPSLIDAKGGDGCTPLHFSRDIATARLLLQHGARVDARDEDHESTPAQWLIGNAPEVSRFLLEHGATADIFLAAALGDRELAERLVEADPTCTAHRIGGGPEFPSIGHNGRGGTIYQWTLAFNSYPHQIALRKGYKSMFDFLYEHSDMTTRFLVSCVTADRNEAAAMVRQNPGIVASLPDSDLELVALYCWETNTNYEAVKLMLDVGFPIAHPERHHGYTGLHNAAWAGSADLVDLLIERGAPVDIVDPGYNSTPLGYARHDCFVEKRHPEGEFGRVFKSLLDAGSPFDMSEYPTGHAVLDDLLKSRLA